jgi:hypothetical protein
MSSSSVVISPLAVVLLGGSSAHASEGGYTNYIPGLYGNFGNKIIG